MKCKPIKYTEENIKEYLHAFKIGDDFWETTKVKKKKNHKIQKVVIIKKKRLANKTSLTVRTSVYGDPLRN